MDWKISCKKMDRKDSLSYQGPLTLCVTAEYAVSRHSLCVLMALFFLLAQAHRILSKWLRKVLWPVPVKAQIWTLPISAKASDSVHVSSSIKLLELLPFYYKAPWNYQESLLNNFLFFSYM